MDDQTPFDVVMVRAEVKVPAGTDPVMVPGALKGLDCGTRLGLFEFGDVVLDGPTTEESDG
jgi:hypothetical protein